MKENKERTKAIAEYILEDENKEEIISELRRYKIEFRGIPDYNYYRYGNILPYYYQIRAFYEDNHIESVLDDTELCEHFCVHVGRAIDKILIEN